MKPKTIDDEIVLKENFTITIKGSGKDFFCRCGCNVFHKPDQTDEDLFCCNSCNTQYRSN